MKKKLYEQLNKGIAQLNLSIPESSISSLIHFIEILLKWNQAYNLTAIRDPEKIITHHILDSLSIIPYFKGNRVIDVGSGAGFPGIPCAFALPEHHFVLLDSNGKKVRFLTHSVAELGLTNVEVVQERVEKYRPEVCFDTIVVRAFSCVENVIKSSRHLLSHNGRVLIMKGIYPQEEIEKIKAQVTVYKLAVPGLNEQRHLVCIEGVSQ